MALSVPVGMTNGEAGGPQLQAPALSFVTDDLLYKRRDRKPNWSDREISRLIQLHHMYRGTLNAPGHDANTIASKQNVWLRITERLNASFPGQEDRSFREVQKKWGNLKSEAKKRAQFALMHQLDPATEAAAMLPRGAVADMSSVDVKMEVFDEGFEDSMNGRFFLLPFVLPHFFLALQALGLFGFLACNFS